MRKLLIALALFVSIGCTSKYQLRGTERIHDNPLDLGTFVGTSRQNRARQITMEHQSVERFENFSLGVIEISDDGAVNPSQKQQVMDMVREETKNGGLLIVFIHGWHHGPRTCDSNICCFRGVLDQLQQTRRQRYPNEKVTGVYIGWRGESLAARFVNATTIYDRKRVAQRIGRTAGKEILVELDQHWRTIPNLTMVSVGHSLGGAFLYEAMKGKLSGNVSDIELGELKDYRVARAQEDRETSLPANKKARRADLGDLVVLVNPAIEAKEYRPFDNDLKDRNTPNDPEQLVRQRQPYDKNADYLPDQMPVLMTVASRKDSAVGVIFPIARALQFFVTLRWHKLFQRDEILGMGHYGPHVTHTLDHPKDPQTEGYDPDTKAEHDCGCPMNYRNLQVPQGFDLRTGRFAPDSPYKFEVTKDRQARGWDLRSPYYVVSTSGNVMSAHSDIFNRVFVGFLISFIDSYEPVLE